MDLEINLDGGPCGAEFEVVYPHKFATNEVSRC